MSDFKSSELILNKDKSVYHLHLLPQHVANTIITVGDPTRVARVSKYFDSITYKIKKREFITHTGFIGKKEITVLSTGIGTDNIDIVLNELNILLNYNFPEQKFNAARKHINIFRIGTSGCIQPHIPIDTFLISEHAIGIDNLLHFYKHKASNLQKKMLTAFMTYCKPPQFIHPYISSASAALVDKFEGPFMKGVTLTAPGFYAPQGRNIHDLSTMYNAFKRIEKFSFENTCITNIEMETSGLYGLSELFGFNCISINALLANRATGAFSKHPDKTVDDLIKKSLQRIATI